MTAVLLPNGRQQYFTTAGLPAVGYKVATFAAGTSTPQVTWQDALKVAQNTNPIILDARGEASIFWEGAYKVQLQDSTGAVIWTQDNLQSQPNGFSASLVPAFTNSVDLGSIALSWRSGYFGTNLFVGPNNLPVLDTASGNVGYFQRSAAEIAVGVVPTSFFYAPGDVRRYGADPTGVVDASTAFANAFLVKGNITALGTFKIGTALTMDGATTSLTGPAIINSTVAAGQVITVNSSLATGSAESVATNCIRGIKFVGTNIAGVRGIYFNSAANLIACFNVENCSFTAFDKFVEFFNNAFEITFRGCVFSQQVGTGGGIYTNTGGANYGERLSFISCAFFNNQICMKSDYTSCQYFLTNCSLDYSNQLIVMNAGWAFLNNCYVENNLDTAYWFVTGAAGASIFFNNGTIVVTSSLQKTFEIGSSSANPGTLNITNSNFYSSANTAKAFIVAGGGNAFGRGNTIQGFANIATAWSSFSSTAQFCSNGVFANGAGGLGGWTVGASAGGNPTTSANTLLLQVTIGGNSQFAYWTLSAQPGENVGFACQVKGNVAAAQFNMTIRAIGADGLTIATQAGSPGFNQFNGTTFPMPTAYTQARAVFPNLPAGTASVQLEFNTNGNTSNTNIVSIQSVYVGKH